MSTTSSRASWWHTLPAEMKFAIVEQLDLSDAKVLSKVDFSTYELCVPAMFKCVKLRNLGQLRRFLDNVPRTYCQHIVELDLCTRTEEETHTHESYHVPRAQTDAVISLLIACPRLAKLALRMAGSLDRSVITPFAYLPDLRQLIIANCVEEGQYPLSERLVVSIAATIPNLEQLSLDRISRSKMHAPDLEGVYPLVPLVIGDDDIPDHPNPRLGSELSLPSLLSIPTLRKLVIRDTHLGDPRWTTAPVACRLEVLDLGSCYHQNEDYNRICTERIMAAVGRTVDEFSLTTSVSDVSFSKPEVTPLPRLRKLHISPFFPVDSVVDTMSNLAGSPIESLSLQCYEDDVVDVCSALEDFLSLRVERGPEFYQKLKSIDVSVAALGQSGHDLEEDEARIGAIERLQAFCRDLRLASVVAKAACDQLDAMASPPFASTTHASPSPLQNEKVIMTNGRLNLIC